MSGVLGEAMDSPLASNSHLPWILWLHEEWLLPPLLPEAERVLGEKQRLHQSECL